MIGYFTKELQEKRMSGFFAYLMAACFFHELVRYQTFGRDKNFETYLKLLDQIKCSEVETTLM